MSPIRHAPADLTSADTSLRAQYLAEVLALLYPDATATATSTAADATAAGATGTGPVLAGYIVVPDIRRARLLVPAADRRIAAGAVARYAEATSRTAKLKRYAVIAALRTGADRALLRDRITVTAHPDGGVPDTIDTYLSRVLGGAFSVSVHIGPARANRKPVLQLLSGDGATIGFGKLGIGPLTRELVRAETAALNVVSRAGLISVAVPRVLHAGRWRSHEVLIQSALPIWEPRSTLSSRRLAEAMRDVATCCGVHTGPLAGDVYWKGLRDRLDRLTAAGGTPRDDGSDPLAEARSLALAADQLIAADGDTELSFGSWHGDWTPWNMASTASRLLVWDWERFTSGVPLGFDAVHFDLQRLIERGTGPEQAVDTMLGRAHRLLAPFGVGPDAARVTALLYLIDLAARYLDDRQAEAGARLGVLGRWLLPVLTRKVTSP